MGFIITITGGLVVWIVLWAIGIKGFDAFLLAAAVILVGRLAEDPLRLSARPSQLAPVLARWLGLLALAGAFPGRGRLRGRVGCRTWPKRPAAS